MTEYSEQVNIRLRPKQAALLDAAVELSPFSSRSEAFRMVLVEWARQVFRQGVRDAMEGDGSPSTMPDGVPTPSTSDKVEA